MTGAREGVVGLGLCVLDELYVVERIALREERTRYTRHLTCAGGMVAGALAQVARMGGRAELLSVVGDDAAGRFLRRTLARAGVGTRHLRLTRAVPTTVALVLVAARGGARRFVVPARRGLERRAPRLDLSAIRRGRVLLVDGHFPVDAARAVRRAASEAVPVVADFNRPTASALALLPFVDYAVVPQEFADAFTPGRPRDTLLRLRDEFGCTPVITQGSRGGLWLDGGRVRRFATPQVVVRDTTGAGDAFHGAFAWGVCQGLPLARNLARAARAGARACRQLGGVLAAPSQPGPGPRALRAQR